MKRLSIKTPCEPVSLAGTLAVKALLFAMIGLLTGPLAYGLLAPKGKRHRMNRHSKIARRHHSDLFICAKKWRDLKDCRFYDQGLNVEVWQNEVLGHTIRFRDMVKLPDAGPSVQWSFVRLRPFGKRRLLEIQLWAAPDPTTGIQTQKWLVYEWRDGHIKKDLDLALQKRKQLNNGNFLDDPAVPHGLSAVVKRVRVPLKGKRFRIKTVRKIEWHCGRQHGDLGTF